LRNIAETKEGPEKWLLREVKKYILGWPLKPERNERSVRSKDVSFTQGRSAMSKENIYLVTIGVLLCILNAVLGGPLGVKIAGLFARLFAPKSSRTTAKSAAKKGAALKSDEVTREPRATVERRDRAA
jgi:hypothetical protein